MTKSEINPKSEYGMIKTGCFEVLDLEFCDLNLFRIWCFEFGHLETACHFRESGYPCYASGLSPNQAQAKPW
jgi:hypothetical protein